MSQIPTTIRKVITIGVYGFVPDTFFSALQEQQVDTFVDIRRRRGVRGAEYAFANSQRLQARLDALGIRYVYSQDLAPTTAIREIQYAVDAAEKTAKRKRDHLSPEFIAAYEADILSEFSLPDFLSALPADAQVIALFCVERDAAACHRSLVAQHLQSVLGIPVVNVVPPAAAVP